MGPAEAGGRAGATMGWQEVNAVSPMTTALAAEQDSSSIGPGSLGFWIVILMLLALLLLYRSLRRQIRKVDFDPEGTTDEERMRGHRESKD